MNLFDRFKRDRTAGEGSPIAGLVRRLKDEDWQVRRDAAMALGELGATAEEAMPALEDAIADDNGEVCLAASDALSKIRIAAL
jgi:HEAT repeat protein